MKKLCYLLTLLALTTLTAQAETQDVVITVNGKPVTQHVAYIYSTTEATFAGATVEKISFRYVDAEGHYSYETYHPTTVQLWFNADPDGIKDIRIYNAGELDGQLDLGGIAPGTPVKVYDTAGKVRLSTTAGKQQTAIGLDGLGRGIYIIRAGKTAIKFMKK